jgi:hypothetical protein
MSDNGSPREALSKYVKIYSLEENNNDELEIKFGSKNRGSMTRIEFESVISKVKSMGFVANVAAGEYHLNIQNQFDTVYGNTSMGNIRTTISGIKSIQEYCRTDSFDIENPPRYISFLQKKPKVYEGVKLHPIDFNDFKFRVNYKEEIPLRTNFNIVKSLLSTWESSKKVFRLLKRFTFTNHKYNIQIDCSVVRSSRQHKGRLVPEYRIESSGLFTNPESYEVEIEVTKGDIKEDALLSDIVENIKLVLSGIQGSNYPISYKEEYGVLQEYFKVLHTRPPNRNIGNRDFVGPSSISLERVNVVELSSDITASNIRRPYAVTEKADGVRKLLFINGGGKLYLIDVNMNAQFTGVMINDRNMFNSILDGEHVLHDKSGAYINNYLIFDIYYINGTDIRSQPFYKDIIEDDKGRSKKTGRLIELEKFIQHLNLEPITGGDLPIKITSKRFLYSDENNNAIFRNCKKILDEVKDGIYAYETDGLIFTPADKGVGSSTTGEVLEPVKKTWRASFKWKPPEFNTIDFLVTTVKSEGGNDIVKNIFEPGIDANTTDDITQYKTLQLRVGFDEKRDGYLNPYEDVIQDRLPVANKRYERANYKPVPFYPTNPSPQFPAYLCNMLLVDKGDINIMTTEDKRAVIEDEMIVEFKYDQTKEKFWQWVPIKVRLDKTAEYRAGGRNYGNSYKVAQSVWNSIHNPVTEDMITSGLNIPDIVSDSDVYYNKKDSDTITRSLRDFHNLYVKRALIQAVTHSGGTLIDMSVGKGGDFPKWIASGLKFVFGVDIARDNIENRQDGACARFLNYKKNRRVMPYALFVNGDSGENIKSGEAMVTDKGKEITRAIFGGGNKDEGRLGKGVFRQYGVGKDGFDVVSNQFSIHYFFASPTKLHKFLRNVSECCKVGGYFIGTTYDGRKVFNRLNDKDMGDSISVLGRDGSKMWDIKKQYEDTVFRNDSSSIGLKIDVYQESINKTFSEYLVNHEYLAHILESYGFVLLSQDESHGMGLPSSSGGFDQLYNKMIDDLKSKRINYSDIGRSDKLSVEEKEVSFLNKYFVFKKIRDVNAEDVSRIFMGELCEEYGESKTDRPYTKKIADKIQITDVPNLVEQKAPLKIKTRVKNKTRVKIKTRVVVKKPQ